MVILAKSHSRLSLLEPYSGISDHPSNDNPTNSVSEANGMHLNAESRNTSLTVRSDLSSVAGLGIGRMPGGCFKGPSPPLLASVHNEAREDSDVASLVELNSILVLNFDRWGTSYLRNILAHGSHHITTKQGCKSLPTELWLDILDLTELYANKNTYKLVYGIDMSLKSTNGNRTKPTLICNVLEDWKECEELKSGDHVNVYEKCLKDPAYKIDPETDGVEEDLEPFFTITKTAREDAFTIPVSHLSFQRDFLFQDIEVPDIIARLERQLFLWEVLAHGNCGHDALCPLCVGEEYANEYLCVLYGKCEDRWSDDEEEEEEDTEEEKMAKKRFREWLQERYRELWY
ncbi:hypothetical protein FGADI_9195 [Fusarium gaditjirri]|uniref:Uncharacterized protein n=1 Tax=Fusarium gaditjirri TaxID=282569 RepID=A0A8H4T035_9HYPO|nr:hypothetical protein FGADI_9195 [Fusarium gaditjirri]